MEIAVVSIRCFFFLRYIHEFFGTQKTEITATHRLPVTPANEYMHDSEWVNNVYNYSQTELTDPTVRDDWKCAYFQHRKPLAVYLRD